MKINRSKAWINEILDAEFNSIIKSYNWLTTQKPEELLGDDSVGWWLLLELGRDLPAKIADTIQKQLDRIIPHLKLERSTLYSATAMLRTLKRANLLKDATKYTRQFYKLINFKNNFTGNIIDIVWVLQAINEITNDNELFDKQLLTRVLDKIDSNDPIIFAMLWPIYKRCQSHDELKNILLKLNSQLVDIVSVNWLTKYLDWQVSYILILLVDVGKYDEASVIAKYLVSRQKDGQWDEETEENIESTSLVALALSTHIKNKYRSFLLKNTDNMINFCFEQLVHISANTKASIYDKWGLIKQLKHEKNKGKHFEEFIYEYILESEKYFTVENTRERTITEEIDIIVENLEADGFYSQLQSRIILIECKNTSKRTGASDIRNFWTKILSRKRLFCKIGIIISVSGFSKDAETEMFRLNSSERELIICGIDGIDIEYSILNSKPFYELVKDVVIKISKQ